MLNYKTLIFYASVSLITLSTANGTVTFTTTQDPDLDAGGTSIISQAGATLSAANLISGTPGTDSTVSVQHTVTGLDLSAVEASATNVSFQFTTTFTASDVDAMMVAIDAPVSIAASGNTGVAGGAFGGQFAVDEQLSVTLSVDAASIVGFSGTINFDGFTQIALANFGNDGDLANILSLDGSFTNTQVSSTANTTSPAGIFQAGNNAIFDLSSVGITDPVTSLALTAESGGQTFNSATAQFTASAAIPEPSSTLLLALSGLFLTFSRKRH